jgi:hypothetical protein
MGGERLTAAPDLVENILDAIATARDRHIHRAHELSERCAAQIQAGERDAAGETSNTAERHRTAAIAIGLLLAQCQAIASGRAALASETSHG